MQTEVKKAQSKASKGKKEAENEEKQNKVLTFRDFSHLSYFTAGTLTQKNYFGLNHQNQQFEAEQSVGDFALDIIDTLIEIAIEAMEEKQSPTQEKGQDLMNNKLYERNMMRMKKKVFVKERVHVVKNRFTMNIDRESKPSPSAPSPAATTPSASPWTPPTTAAVSATSASASSRPGAPPTPAWSFRLRSPGATSPTSSASTVSRSSSRASAPPRTPPWPASTRWR